MEYKRQSRHPSEEVKKRISQTLKGRHRLDATKEKIAASMKHYWSDDSNFPDDHQTTIKDLI